MHASISLMAAILAAPGACTSAEKHEKDFRVGQWDVVYTKSNPAIARGEVSRAVNDCAIEERFGGKSRAQNYDFTYRLRIAPGP